MSEIRRLARYLGVSPSLADTVAEKTHFSNMKTAKSQVGTSFRHLFKDKEFSQHVYRKGTHAPSPSRRLFQSPVLAEANILVSSFVLSCLGCLTSFSPDFHRKSVKSRLQRIQNKATRLVLGIVSPFPPPPPPLPGIWVPASTSSEVTRR